MKHLILFLCLVFILSGCAPAMVPAGSIGEPLPSPLNTEENVAVPQETGTAGLPVDKSSGEGKNSVDTNGAVLELEQSGGIAGRIEKWTVYADGRIESSTGKSQRVPTEDIQQALTDLEEIGVYKLQDSYGMFTSCRDCFNLTLTVNNGSQVKTISAVEGDTNTPDEVWKVFDRVNQLLGDTR
jgi:hypothetical protein